MPTQFFTDGNDTFTVTAAGDYNLVFLDGNDTLTVNGGTFTTGVMGEGADVITLRSGDALIYGDGGTDRFEIYGSGFEARGGSDNDLFNIRGGDNLILRGDGGDDRFTFFAGSLSIVLRGGLGNDVINGRNQVISGNFYGDAGNDTFTGFRNAGGTVPNLRGGLGDDIYVANPTAPANFVENAGEGTDIVQVAGGRTYALPANIENLMAGAFAGAITGAATLDGNGLNNLIQGYTNPETINGLGGNDTLLGGGGADHLNGGDGRDILDGQTGSDAMAGGTGNDTYYVNVISDTVTEAAGGGNDLIHTTVDYTLPDFVENGTVDTPDGATLTGNERNNILTGGTGVDHLIGGGGNDVLRGGLGRDFLTGGTGNDRFYVDDPNDFVIESAGEGTDTIYLDMALPAPIPTFPPPPPTPIFYQIDPNAENIVVTRFEQPDQFGQVMQGGVYGNALNNVMTDSGASRFMNGLQGDDTLNGNGGNDTLVGGEGFDTINGGAGNDTIIGDGNDTGAFAADMLTGGAGADQFVYYHVEDSAPFIQRVDQITDFETGSDKIYLNADADANTLGIQNWTIVDAPTNAAGQLWIDSSDSANGNYAVFGDDDGDGLADLMIQIHALTTFSASDIVL